MVRRTAHDAQLTRLRILHAAAGVFCRQGIALSTLEDVARQAGVTRGAVYWHFKGKHDLLVELLDAATLPIEQMTPGQSLAEDCQQLISALLKATRNPGMRGVLQLLMQRSEHGETQAYIQRRSRSVRKHLTEYLSRVLYRALVAGELAPAYGVADVAPLVMTMRAGLNGLMFELLFNSRLPEQRVREIVRLLFTPLTHAPPSEVAEASSLAAVPGREASCPINPVCLHPAAGE